MSRALGPKGVRARLIAGSQLPAHGPAPPRFCRRRCRRLESADRHRRERRASGVGAYDDRRSWRSFNIAAWSAAPEVRHERSSSDPSVFSSPSEGAAAFRPPPPIALAAAASTLSAMPASAADRKPSASSTPSSPIHPTVEARRRPSMSGTTCMPASLVLLVAASGLAACSDPKSPSK